jgi:hypothetical protein
MCLASAIVPLKNTWISFRPAFLDTFGRVRTLALILLLAIGLALIGPAALGAAREYPDKVIFRFPARWLGWVAIPLALNAVAVIWFVLVPRIRARSNTDLGEQ